MLTEKVRGSAPQLLDQSTLQLLYDEDGGQQPALHGTNYLTLQYMDVTLYSLAAQFLWTVGPCVYSCLSDYTVLLSRRQ